MSAPTKADPLYERMEHAFGQKRIHDHIKLLTCTWATDPLHWLTDEARDVLLHRLMADHKFNRKITASNRKIYREKQNVV